MKILIAPDKFKGSLTAMEACQAIKRGIEIANPQAKCTLHPMADGGDGSLAILKKYLKSEYRWVRTKDPLGRPLKAPYFVHESTAYIEMAKASGLALLLPEVRNPLLTDSIGTGILIKDALDKNIRKIVLLAGGSATNDGGLGIAYALGFRFYDKMAKELLPIGKHLIQITRIEKPINLPDFDLEILYDVNNPLYGPDGAAQVYAAQKGADQKAIELLDDGLKNLAEIIEKQFNRSIAKIKGAGSAGGLGGGLHGLLKARLSQGFKRIAEISNLEHEIKKSDLVITGEGRLDEQSLKGKVIGGILNYCKIHQTSVQAIVGANHLSNEALQETNIDKVLSIMAQAISEKEAMNKAPFYLTQLAVELGAIKPNT